MTTTNQPIPTDPAPPPGTSTIDEWGSGGEGRRVILGHDRRVIDSDVLISTACIQHRDGHIDDGSTGDEAPSVYIDGAPASLNSDQARVLAALLLESAALIDGWVQR